MMPKKVDFLCCQKPHIDLICICKNGVTNMYQPNALTTNLEMLEQVLVLLCHIVFKHCGHCSTSESIIFINNQI